MNEQRLKVYIQLIQQLLECPQGQEQNILQNHQHLIDKGFIAFMQQYAKAMLKVGKTNGALRLLNMAQKLTQWLNKPQNPVSYNSLLQELLQAEYEVYAKPDKGIVYHILDNNRHLLNENLAYILPKYASDLIANNSEDTNTIVALIENLSLHIYGFPRGDRKAQIEIAIAGYLFTLSHHEENTKDWAKTQNSLGSAYRQRIKGNTAENIESAIACCQAALRVFTKSDYPQDWAMTQNSLGTAYSNRIKGNKGENIESAIKCYQNADWSYPFPPASPRYWAMIKSNLGLAYCQRIKGNKADNIESAIACYKPALIVFTESAYPQDWAMIQYNLGLAYYSVGPREVAYAPHAMTQNDLELAYPNRVGNTAENIESAIKCYQAALRVRTFSSYPLDWAMTQHNLGLAYCQRIKGNKADNIESAIKCYQAALRVRTFSSYPLDWAMTQHNLGIAYCQRIKGNKAENIETAIACYQTALRVRTFSAYPLDWAMSQKSLGTAYYSRIKGNAAENIETAIACYQTALRVYTESDYPQSWAMTQSNLGLAYSDRIKGNAADNIESAIKCYQAALRVRPFSASGKEEEMTEHNLGLAYSSRIEGNKTQHNLGLAYYSRIKGNKADNIESAIKYYQDALRLARGREREMTELNLGIAYSSRIKGNTAHNIESAIKYYQYALRVRTESAYPQDWAMIQHNLGLAYYSRIKGNKAENIESAIDYYQAALRVRTFSAYPLDWAMIQHNLGLAYCQRIKGNKAENIESAIGCCQAALRVRTFSAYPLDWAMTQHNLGIAYSSRIKGNKAENIESAIDYYQGALRVRTFSNYPQDWAMTQNSLGTAYSSRIKGNKAENIESVIAYYQAALRVRTFSDYPRDWAMTQHNLGAAYYSRIKGNAAENIESAIDYYQDSLRVRTFSDYPQDWAMTQHNLGLAYSDRIKGNAAENIESAIKYYQTALRVHTESDYPLDWAETQNCLGSAYKNRIKGNIARNIESAIACHQTALRVFTESAHPRDWAETQKNLGAAYSDRIKGNIADNIESAIKYYQDALRVYTESDYPRDWAETQNNLGLAYVYRIKGNIADSRESAIACYQAALRVRKPETLPADCLKTARQLANLASTQKNYQLAIDNYEIAITAIEQSRDWIPDEIARQEILRKNRYVYENMIQACVNTQQYDKALETVETFRCRRLLDLILTKDLYKNTEVPEAIRDLEKQMEAKQWEIDSLRRQLETPEEKKLVGASRNFTRDEWDDITEDIRKLIAEKREIWQQMRQLDPVLAEGQQAPGVSVEKMKELLEIRNDPPQPPLERGEMEREEMEKDDVALLSFYTTRDDTYIFILTQTGVKLHRCQEQGLNNLQQWLQDNWLEPYADIDYLARFQAGAILIKCDVDAIESINPKPSNVVVKLKDGTTTEISLSDFNTSRKQQKDQLYKQWQDKMEGMLKELADRLQINQLIEKLTDIKEIILVPFMYLHQIPLPALPLENGEYLGDKFRVRIAPSTQVLTFCRQQPQNPEAKLPRYGIVENTRDDLPYTPKECELVAQIYGVAPQHHLKGSKQATKAKYKQLLTREKVLGLLSSHHAKSNLTEPLESKLLLGDTDLTLGELLNASIRFPQLGDLFLSCCETALGNSELTDDIFTLSAAFLSAGASNVISSLWSVNDLATTILSYFYHRNRAEGIPSADALWQAQMELKELTLAKAEESLEDAEEELEEFAEGSREYEEKEKIADNCQKVLDLVSEAKKSIGGEKPFNHPYYWAGFVCQGEG